MAYPTDAPHAPPKITDNFTTVIDAPYTEGDLKGQRNILSAQHDRFTNEPSNATLQCTVDDIGHAVLNATETAQALKTLQNPAFSILVTRGIDRELDNNEIAIGESNSSGGKTTITSTEIRTTNPDWQSPHGKESGDTNPLEHLCRQLKQQGHTFTPLDYDIPIDTDSNGVPADAPDHFRSLYGQSQPKEGKSPT